MTIAERRKRAEHRAKEPAQPDTLAFAADADAIHPVIPVTRSH